MSRNFIFNARKQGGSARNLNLSCGLGASKQDFGAQRVLGAYGHGLLRSAEYCDLGARRHGFLQSTKYRDIGVCEHRLLRDAKRYDFVACIDGLFRDIGCCDLSASGYSLSQDIGRRGFIAPKYELCSRENCDYSVSVLLNGAVCCGFAAQNSSKSSRNMYCGSSASTYLRRSPSMGDYLRRVNANRDTRSRRDSSASASLRRSSNANDPLQRVSDRPARAARLHCRFGAQHSARKALLSAYRSLFCDASGLGGEQNPALGTFCAVRNFLNLHVARDFKNFSPVNLKKFNFAASQFVNLKKQIRAGEGADKSANSRNWTSFGRETRMLRRLDSESKILAPRSSCFESEAGALCGPDLWHRGREAAQNFKRFVPDFTQNFKNFDWDLEVEPIQRFRGSGQNFESKFPQSTKNSDRNLEAGPARSFKDQNLAQGSSQNGRSYEPNSAQGFSQSIKNSEPCPAQRQELGFYAPKFKDERARNFFSHPMRAFVLCACFFAALGALSFLAPDALAIDYVSAHKFYFLFLAPSCIYAAFLLTALPDWTNFEGSLKPVSLAFAACLIAAFIASFLNLRAAAAIVALFWAIFFIFAARLLWLDKNSNNFSILAVLAAFCACSAAYGASGDEKFLLSFVHINVAAIAVVSYRISVVIGNEALREAGLKDAVFIPNFIYKNLTAFLAFALALASPFLSEATCGFIALGIGFLFLAKLRELHYVEILSRHYMAFYYALQAACAAGYAWLGWELIRGGYAAAPLHVIAICYIYGAILFVGMIAGQRHSGISPLNFPRLSRAALVLALSAGALRAVFAGESFILYVMIPSALFIAAVALYLINFVPIFLKNPFSADPD